MKNDARIIFFATIALHAVVPVLRAVDSSRPANASYAQQVANSLRAAHPDVAIIELHAKPPGSDGQILVVGSDSAIGRKDTDFELRMTAKDVTSIAAEKFEGNATVLVRVPLHDRTGKVIGLGVIGFKPTPAVDRLMLHVRALEILDELAQRIPEAAPLFKAN